MGSAQIRKPLSVFLKRVKAKYRPQAVVLFGSRARGAGTKESDVDLIVIAAAFEGVDEEQRFSALYELSGDLWPDFHVYGFTPEEATKVNAVNTLSEALRSGVLVG
jgi:predicted nucleotidyltransferase